MNPNNAHTVLCKISLPALGIGKIVLIYSPIVKVYWTTAFDIF